MQFYKVFSSHMCYAYEDDAINVFIYIHVKINIKCVDVQIILFICHS